MGCPSSWRLLAACATGALVLSYPLLLAYRCSQAAAAGPARRSGRGLGLDHPQQQRSGQVDSNPYACSNGCVAVMGNGFVSAAQTATAHACARIYKANKMQSSLSYASTASVCFFRQTGSMPHFYGMSSRPRTGWQQKRQFMVRPSTPVHCNHTVFVANHDAGLLRTNRWGFVGSHEVVVPDLYGKMLDSVVPRLDPKPSDRHLGILNSHRQRPPWDASTGAVMLAYALKTDPDKCIHLFGFNFNAQASEAQQNVHSFGLEQVAVWNFVRSRNLRVFFHTVPGEGHHPPPGQPLDPGLRHDGLKGE